MGFPSINTAPTLDESWREARLLASQIKQNAQDNVTAAATGINGRSLIGLSAYMADQYARLGILAAIPNLAAYAQTQVSNPSLDVASAFNTMRTAMVNVVSWIMTNFPKDASSNLLYQQFTGDGHTTYTTFTSGQLAPLVTLLNALIATID